jgi:hypothetical protein
MISRGSASLAVAVGAAAYIVAAIIRTQALHYFHLAGHWLSSIDALLIYCTALSAGFIAGLLYRKQVFLIGFCAGAAGEFAYGAFKVLAGLNLRWSDLLALPMGYVLDMIFAALASGVLGAAGAASAVVACGHWSTRARSGPTKPQ